MTPTDNILIDRVQIIGTNHIVWKAWHRVPAPSPAWPHGYGYHTITYFNGIPYGRMGTESFDPTGPIPSEYRVAGRSQDWRHEQFIAHKVAITQAAHAAILLGMPKTEARSATFDDNGTITMEE